jgi:hypothetical protein
LGKPGKYLINTTQAQICFFSLLPFCATDDYPAHESIFPQSSTNFKGKIARLLNAHPRPY